MAEFESCGKCKNGYIYSSSEVEKCMCRSTWQYKERLSIKISKANIPPFISENKSLLEYNLSDYIGKDKKDNISKIKKFISNFEKYKRRNLFLSGKIGTQKSTLARYISKELLSQNYTVYYTLADTLIKNLQDADRNEELKEKYNEIINTDFLVIDEMSEDKITTYKSGWQNTFLLPFLKRRIEIVRKSVCFISNAPIDNIGDYFKGAIQDLIYREVADKDMVFKDNYNQELNRFDPSTLWD